MVRTVWAAVYQWYEATELKWLWYLAFRKTLVCIPGAKRFRCKRGTALSFVDIKLSRSPAPGHRCRHHARNEDNSTLPNDHRCNVTKVIAKVRKRCQGRQECWISFNERHLGSACVKEVKFLQVNFTCEQSKCFLRSIYNLYYCLSSRCVVSNAS